MMVSLQYNQEIHYVEPCLNGTLVRADRANKDVSANSTNLIDVGGFSRVKCIHDSSSSILGSIWTSCLLKASVCWGKL